MKAFMSVEQIIEYLITNKIEFIGTILGFYAVVLMIKQNIWCWPVGIANAVLYAIMFYNNQLYSDLLLHICYIILFIYGWYEWLYGGKNKTEIQVKKTPKKEYLPLISFGLFVTIALGFYFSNYSNASLAYFDSFNAAFSLVAQFMLARKYLENWILWLLVDILATGMYLYKGLYITAILFFLYLILAAKGYFEWKKIIKEKSA
jgi:nicotinamide mononucleotide transporter